MKQTIEEAKVYLRDTLAKLDSIEFVEDDLVEEEYQGNLTNETLSQKAKMHFTISDDEWLALSDEEKEDFISRLPPEKMRAGGEEMSDRDSDEDCDDCDDEEDEDESEDEVVETDEISEPVEEKPRHVLKDAERVWSDKLAVMG